ncbi:MAG: Pyridoxamine 5-phosphate oxidase [Pedosphaera sp.]|nr:Pyridoxamine 5-phosphate oxidase [Pedosphaera sp.]
MVEHKSIADLRRDYTLAGLRRADLNPDPVAQFSKWLDQAVAARLPDPNAMTISSVDAGGQPSGRIVLLKAVDRRGFTFFTNYESRKGQELAGNAKASLVFFWAELERQVCITGTVTKVSREESAKYFNSRPKGSRLAAWVSSQSEVIANRAVLEKKLDELTVKYPGEEVPLPPYWGGFCLAPAVIEFWQGRPNRLHDRFRYSQQPDHPWTIERLSP